MNIRELSLIFAALFFRAGLVATAAEVIEADVCVYGGTAGGVVAAVQTARMGKTAVVAEFSSHLGGLTPGSWCVLELSSFQLQDMTCSPRVGAVLNITPNHLDRHPDMDDYVHAKGNMVRYQRAGDVK